MSAAAAASAPPPPTEVSPAELRCNACWKVTNEADKRSFRTRCSHLFCEPCAKRFFTRRLVCPVCDESVDGETGILELSHAHNVAIMTQVSV